jgi:competence/damage-inducible protein CinA-like protein
VSERPRAVVVVTGSELVRGERTDRNGPFLAAEALRNGLEPARITIVGDAPAELEAVLRQGLEADACLVSGGLGPTHDDRTVELLARAAGLELVVDEALEREIDSISRLVAERLRRPYADFAPGVTKQATRPAPAISIGLAGTAPGLVLRAPTGCVVVVLPGPPAELRRLWPNALASEPLRELLQRTRPPGRHVLRLFGVSESAVARAFDDAGGDGDGVEATICARDFEIHVDLIVEPGAEERGNALEAALAERLEPWLFARDERRVEELVLSLAGARGLRLATAESCTGGLVAARLTDVPGSSASFVGGIVSYADEVKRSELDVPEELLAQYGAVSAEVAAAMAEGARRRLRADVAVAVTGVAGPGGGTPEKPVGRVYLQAAGPDGSLARMLDLPGERQQIRVRATVTALHLLRALLTGSRDEPAGPPPLA